MGTWMDGAMLIEITMLSFLLALWLTWMSLRGLFQLISATKLVAVTVRLAGHRAGQGLSRRAA
jgi:hypothetical protein